MSGPNRDRIESLIRDFIENSPENTLQDPKNEKAFDAPLVGFAAGDDPIFIGYKVHVGPFHWTPQEIFNLTFPQAPAEAGELTVISWILPQTSETRGDNRREKKFPAERWARARIFGEEVNVKLRKLVVNFLAAEGVDAIAPQLAEGWEVVKSDRYTFASRWSERHAAHAAGLGTFGLCDGLITPVGKAMRTGSVVARLKLPTSPRPYADHRAWCLFFSKGVCGVCIDRCPVEALSSAGHDKVKCRAHLFPDTNEYVKENYGFDGYGCGLCQVGVPCEFKIPAGEDL